MRRAAIVAMLLMWVAASGGREIVPLRLGLFMAGFVLLYFSYEGLRTGSFRLFSAAMYGSDYTVSCDRDKEPTAYWCCVMGCAVFGAWMALAGIKFIFFSGDVGQGPDPVALPAAEL